MRWFAALLVIAIGLAASGLSPAPDADDAPGEGPRRGGLVTATLRCRCGATIHAAGNPAVGLALLRHGDDPYMLALYDDDPLLPRACAGDPGVLAARPIRAWLGARHGEPGAPETA